MRHIIITLVACFISNIAVAAQPQKAPQVALYCIGETSSMFGQERHSETEAFLSVAEDKTYLEINGVGSGYARGRPTMLTSMQANTSLTLASSIKGGAPIDVQFTINVFTGSLAVVSFGANNAAITFFNGTCKKAEPLF